MANAIPVNSKNNPKETPAEVKTHGGEGGLSKEALQERANEIVAGEVPARILDEQVNQIGQASSYGKYQSVQEVSYPVYDRKGEVVSERTCIRIDH
jgi:hypothetical protein